MHVNTAMVNVDHAGRLRFVYPGENLVIPYMKHSHDYD
jgi:hypothetical protein